MAKRHVHYVLSTHWDREWYQTFQDFRYRLVQLLDRVLDGVRDGRLRGPFQCDGQAIILEDYLEVRPERRNEVERFAREGKLLIGPWYVLPDEFLVSGESLVRNLRLGREMARAFGGKPSNAGFMCDMFGHNSQMPQILRGFDIVGALIWRGCNVAETRNLIWRGADGTEIPCYRFGERGYCTYAVVVRRAGDYGASFDPQSTRCRLDAHLKHEIHLTSVDPILLFDGCDHQEWDQECYQALTERMDAPDRDLEIIHSSLDAYVSELETQAHRIDTIVEGELREPGNLSAAENSQWLIPGVLSSRVWIRQENAHCQSLLCQWAEPFGAMAHALLETEYPQGYLDVAWRWLLRNHPHDSICGCSIDQVHEDMRFRFSQCRGIGDRLTIEATRRLAASVEGDLADDELRVTLYNPCQTAISETADLIIRVPTDWTTFNEFFGFEPKPGFRIYASDGREIPYQRLGQAMDRAKKRIHDTKFPEAYRSHDVTVSLPVDVPAMGYTALTVRPDPAGGPTRHRETPGMATSERSMANDRLSVTIEANGTLTVEDRRTGQTYSRLLTFEDAADIGDGWYHGVATNDQQFVSGGAQADIALVHDGPMVTTFRVRTTMNVPESFLFDSMTRSPQFVALTIDSLVTLRPGSDRIEVTTTVDNIARDHRLRVLFPSGARTDTYLADSAFDVVERPIALREDNHTYRELEVETKPQQRWTAVFDEWRGLAVVSDGLLETAVRDLPERPIALTLFRATRRTVMTDGEPNGQLSGQMTFRYWIVPLHGDPDRVRLGCLGQQLAAEMRSTCLRRADQAHYATQHRLPPSVGLLRVEGTALLTSARMVDGALEVHLFNPNTLPGTALIHLGTLATFGSAQRVNLESRPLGEAWPLKDERVSLELGAKEIATLRLQ